MSVATEISRIQTARNTIRAKAVELGIGTSVDTLDKLATEIEGIENRGAVSAEVQEGDTYTIPKGYHNGSGKVTVNVSSSSGSSNNNVEAYAITNTNPSVSFKRTDGAIKIWGYGTMTSQGGWGGQTTSLVAFAGDKYYKGAIYGGPSSTSLSLSISNGKLTGLPSGLTAINAIVTRGI